MKEFFFNITPQMDYLYWLFGTTNIFIVVSVVFIALISGYTNKGNTIDTSHIWVYAKSGQKAHDATVKQVYNKFYGSGSFERSAEQARKIRFILACILFSALALTGPSYIGRNLPGTGAFSCFSDGFFRLSTLWSFLAVAALLLFYVLLAGIVAFASQFNSGGKSDLGNGVSIPNYSAGLIGGLIAAVPWLFVFILSILVAINGFTQDIPGAVKVMAGTCNAIAGVLSVVAGYGGIILLAHVATSVWRLIKNKKRP
jgi:hypothetical protein